jgi:transcriptional regulator with XRE-family HTH domain
MPVAPSSPFGHALRQWRTTRHLSQLELAHRAATPPRHVSFLETGRARPSRDMVLRLADALDVPAAECNTLLSAAGFAPQFTDRPLSDGAMSSVRDVVARLLASHGPFPALVLNAWYDVVDLNAPARTLFSALGVHGAVGAPNLVTLLLGALRPTIVNWEEVLFNTRDRLRHEWRHRPGDARLGAMLADVDARCEGVPVTSRTPSVESPVLLTGFRTPAGVLHTLSTLVQFSGARDLTVHGLHVELIYPADTHADTLLRALCATHA